MRTEVLRALLFHRHACRLIKVGSHNETCGGVAGWWWRCAKSNQVIVQTCIGTACMHAEASSIEACVSKHGTCHAKLPLNSDVTA
jgi:hypothetical protein